jgi:hypothetical protein
MIRSLDFELVGVDHDDNQLSDDEDERGGVTESMDSLRGHREAWGKRQS